MTGRGKRDAIDLTLKLLAHELDRVAKTVRHAAIEAEQATARPVVGPPALYAVGGKGEMSHRARAMELYHERRERDRLFAGSGLVMAEPAWDMMLLLYALQSSGQRVAIMDICNAGNVSQTTGLRHLSLLIEHRLVTRAPDPLDGRRALVAFSDKGMALIETFLSGIERSPGDRDSDAGAEPSARLGQASAP